MNRIFQVFLSVVVCGTLLYGAGMAYGTYVNKQLGAMVGTIVDPIAAIAPCPQGNEQLVQVFDNTRLTGWTALDCIDNICVVSSEGLRNVDTICVNDTSSCTPSTILNTLVNVRYVDMSVDGPYGIGFSTTLSAGVGVGEQCVDVNGVCMAVENIVAVPAYASYYFGDTERDTFAPNKIHVCRTGTGFPATTPECLSVTGGTNTLYKGLAIDSTTNSLYFHYGSFNSLVAKFSLTGNGNLISADVISPALSFNVLADGGTTETMVVDEGGNVYVARSNGTTIEVVVLDPNTLVVIDSFPGGVTLNSEATIWFDNVRSHLYVCVRGVAGADITIAKLTSTGTILATKRNDEVGSCKNVRTSGVSNKVYIIDRNDTIRELDIDTLAVLQVLTLPPGPGNGAMKVRVDDLNRKVYFARRTAFNGLGSISSISTCST